MLVKGHPQGHLVCLEALPVEWERFAGHTHVVAFPPPGLPSMRLTHTHARVSTELPTVFSSDRLSLSLKCPFPAYAPTQILFFF